MRLADYSSEYFFSLFFELFMENIDFFVSESAVEGAVGDTEGIADVTRAELLGILDRKSVV